VDSITELKDYEYIVYELDIRVTSSFLSGAEIQRSLGVGPLDVNDI